MAVDLYPIVEKKDNRIAVCGFANRHIVHGKSLWHLTVQVIPVIMDKTGNDCFIIIHRRPPDLDDASNKLDFCGGHLVIGDFFYQGFDWNESSLLEQASKYAARREAREEIRCEPQIEIELKDMHLFGKAGDFRNATKRPDGSKNCEFSSVFVVGLPPNCKISILEHSRKRTHELTPEPKTFEELINEFRNKSEEFADGATRILKEISKNRSMANKLHELMIKAAKSPCN